MAFLYAADAWLSRTWCFGMMPAFCICSRALSKDQDKFAAGALLEGLRPQRVAVNIMNDHDVFVAKAGDLWKMPCLIGVHSLLKFADANKYIPFIFMWGVFGGAYALLLTAHVSLLRFFRLGEIACDICDVHQGPRVVIAPSHWFEPSLSHRESRCRM